MITGNICLDMLENFAFPQLEEDEVGTFQLITATLIVIHSMRNFLSIG
jgi:hypothetical protein